MKISHNSEENGTPREKNAKKEQATLLPIGMELD